MSRLLPAILLATFLAPCATATAATLTKEQAARFDADGDGNVDADKAAVYVRHLYDETGILALHDRNLNGIIDPEETEEINERLALINRERVSSDVRLRIEQGVPIPLQRVPASFERVASKNVSSFYLRERRIEIGIEDENPEGEVTSGASISTVTDLDGEDTVVSVSAAAGYLFRRGIDLPEDYEGGEIAVTAVSVGPYVEAKGTINSTNSRLSIGAIGQLEMLGGPFDLQRWTVAPYYQTDFDWNARIYGASASWEPYVLNWALGSIRRLPGDVADVNWQFAAEADYRHVEESGGTSLAEGEEYAWIGFDATMRFWPLPELFDNRVFGDAAYAYHYDLVSGEEASRFRSGVGVHLDQARNTAITVEYVNGKDYRTMREEETVRSALKVKY